MKAVKDKLRILLRIALVLLLVCGVTVGVLYVNRRHRYPDRPA